MELHEAALASMKEASVDQAELQRCEEALALEAAERTLDLERLEMMSLRGKPESKRRLTVVWWRLARILNASTEEGWS